MGMTSHFFLINENDLKSYFEIEANNELLLAIENRKWEEIIYHDIAIYPKTITKGFLKLPKNYNYNRVVSFRFSQLIGETKTVFGFKKFEAGYYLEKGNILGWLNFMLALCKRFNEFEKDEPCWDLLDVKIKNTDQKIIDDYFEYYLMCTINNKIPDKYDLNYMLVAHRISDFKLIKKRITENEVDYLLFVYSY
jgi:hypothetical protein